MQGITPPQRWDAPYDPEMSETDVDRILSIAPFKDMNAQAFPASTPLRGVVQNDMAIRTYQQGDIIVREGDYGNSAFFILDGTARVVLEDLPSKVLGRRESIRKGVWSALAQFWHNPSEQEIRHIHTPDAANGEDQVQLSGQRGTAKNTRIFLQDVPAILETYQTAQIQAGEYFGEIAALGRTPRTATVFAEEEMELLEIRWQGLRDIRRSSPKLKEHIDALYRERSLLAHLQNTPIFEHLNEQELDDVAKQTEFETYGNFDWYMSYHTLAEQGVTEALEQEPIIAQEEHYPNGLILIRSGMARLSKRFGHGHRTESYLGRGHMFGWMEIVHNWEHESEVPLQYTLRAIGYVDVLIVPTRAIEQLVLGADRQQPRIDRSLLPPLVTSKDVNKKVLLDEELDRIPIRISQTENLGHEILEPMVAQRFINGTSTMLIDMERCTRCDDCVKACAATHNNNPRFIRHGPQIGRFMVANACMHCVDPVCLIGCPTGSINRDPYQGQVLINDATCIGCSTCANSCPYHNIRMVEIRDESGAFILDETTHLPWLKATKCDLCIEQLSGPACQNACPHDALKRIDIHDYPETLAEWIRQK